MGFDLSIIGRTDERELKKEVNMKKIIFWATLIGFLAVIVFI